MHTRLKKSILLMLVALLQVPVWDLAAREMMKPKAQDIVDITLTDERFSIFLKMVQQAGLEQSLRGTGPFTVFMPTDEAFKKVPNLEALLKPENKERLTQLLTYHIVGGEVVLSDIEKLKGQEMLTIDGRLVKVEVKRGALYIEGSKVVLADLVTKNGMIHVIDTVLVPK